MKKSLMLGAAVAAMSISSAASALNAAGYRGSLAPMISDGFPPVGRVASLLATGPAGPGVDLCSYILSWQDPLNPGNVSNCTLYEARGTVNPSCNQNRTQNFATSIAAGPFAGTTCNGYDFLGNPLAGVSLVLAEIQGGAVGNAVQGVMFHLNIGFLPIRF